MSEADNIRVLVTGFGAFQDVTVNPSHEIVSRLPASLPGGIRILAHPAPLRAAYHPLVEAAPRLIREHGPDIVLHVGLAADRDYFAVERSAARDGYHQVPDVDRRVLTKAESRALWGGSGSGSGKKQKSPEVLQTSLDLPAVVEAWRSRLRRADGGAAAKGKKGAKAPIEVDMRLSDDVGNYVCGLVYYASLAELAQRGGPSAGSAVFLHVPPLPTGEDVERGRVVLVALIEALVEVWKQRE
ncbi:hypothetical protein F4778DRAFT_574834 [Xylariomycetidae sp. FL2044]|nr:hypothetical protein F4778DRAFT_574834 [Xylariomycetidae sp. FL2044]